jgi:hypothetical protein
VSDLRTSETTSEISGALVKAQASFPTIAKDRKADVKTKTGKDYSYTYADLASTLEGVRKPLADNGLAVIQPTAVRGDQVVLVTRIIHTSGEWIEGTYPLRTYERPQDTGSALTYARRYALTALLGIATEDDDGQQAEKAKPERRSKPAARGGDGDGAEGSGETSVPSPDTSKHSAEEVKLAGKKRHLSALARGKSLTLEDLAKFAAERELDIESSIADVEKAIALLQQRQPEEAKA